MALPGLRQSGLQFIQSTAVIFLLFLMKQETFYLKAHSIKVWALRENTFKWDDEFLGLSQLLHVRFFVHAEKFELMKKIIEIFFIDIF